MSDVEVIQVVRTSLERRGRGVDGDPVRRITQFWSLDGELLAEVDPMQDAHDFVRQAGRYSRPTPEAA